MELSEYLAVLKKNIVFIVVLAAVGALIGYYVATKIPSGFRSSEIFFLKTLPQNNSVYTFDGYYSQEKARNFTDTAVSLISNYNFAAEIGAPQTSIDVTKLAPQLLKITATSKQKQDTEQVLKKIAPALNLKLQNIYQGNNMELVETNTNPQAELSSPSKKILTAFGALLGIVFSLTAISLKTFFRI